MMEEREEISAEILMDATEMITCLIISRNLDTDRVMPTFQKEASTEKKTTERIKRIGRASGMTKIRKELDKLKNNRKEEGSRSWSPEDFRDMEFREVTRKELRKRSEYIRSTEVRNNLVQNRGERIQVIGSDVEPSIRR